MSHTEFFVINKSEKLVQNSFFIYSPSYNLNFSANIKCYHSNSEKTTSQLLCLLN